MDGSVWGAGCRAELSVIGNFRTSAGAMLGASPAHQESVIDPGQGIDGVEGGHEKGRRLRISRGNESRRGERTEWAARARITKQPADLAEQVERIGIRRMAQDPVAVRCQTLWMQALDQAAPLDAGPLGRATQAYPSRIMWRCMGARSGSRPCHRSRSPLDDDRPIEP